MILATLRASSSVYSALLILGVQVKTIMLIQQAEKEENSSSKRYKMSKWSFGDAILMTDWNTVFTATWHFVVPQYWNSGWLDEWMTHKQMMNWILSRTFFDQGTNLAIIIWL